MGQSDCSAGHSRTSPKHQQAAELKRHVLSSSPTPPPPLFPTSAGTTIPPRQRLRSKKRGFSHHDDIDNNGNTALVEMSSGAVDLRRTENDAVSVSSARSRVDCCLLSHIRPLHPGIHSSRHLLLFFAGRVFSHTLNLLASSLTTILLWL